MLRPIANSRMQDVKGDLSSRARLEVARIPDDA